MSVGEMLKDGYLLHHMDGNHGALYPRASEFVEAGVPYLTANAIISGQVDWTQAKYLTPERAGKLQKGFAKDGDVLFAHNATVGPVALLRTDEEQVVLSTTLTYYRCNPNKLDNRYLKHALGSSLFSRQYERIMGQSTRNQVPITTQRKLHVPLPPLAEQKKIAEILSCWDRAIELLEKLKIQLSYLARATSYQLYSAKFKSNPRRIATDLGNFPEGWTVKRLKDVCSINKSSLSASTPEDEEFYYVDLSAVKSRNVAVPVEKMRFAALPSRARRRAQIGDILMATVRPNLKGFAQISSTKTPLVVSTGFAVLETHRKQDAKYLLNYLFSHLMERQVNSLIVGSNYPALNSNDVGNLLVPWPESDSIREMIGNQIDLIYSQVTTLSAVIELIERQKKGLMQKLLTGKIRVKV
ncbi:MAG TPA: restriction endonuclease subunit S [Oligoflexia bacterium]|nr:restriction endonuclease subunit S [Oligoflexia bacterium]